MNAGRVSAVVISLALGSSGALAQQAPEPEKKAGPAAPAAGGLVVFVDPVTGKIRQPDAAEIGRLLSLPAAPGASARRLAPAPPAGRDRGLVGRRCPATVARRR